MIFRNIHLGLGLRSILIAKAKSKVMGARFLHEVYHSSNKHIFFIPLGPDFDKQAVLYYKFHGKVMNLYGINVPKRYKGQGLARLLTETAFTYAIVNNYYLFLTCLYVQNYYLANKNSELRKRIVGPKKILDLPVSLDHESFEELPDPEDYPNTRKY